MTFTFRIIPGKTNDSQTVQALTETFIERLRRAGHRVVEYKVDDALTGAVSDVAKVVPPKPEKPSTPAGPLVTGPHTQTAQPGQVPKKPNA
jgi:hypothetical protein